jgi:Zn-dependent protease with chaperone function
MSPDALIGVVLLGLGICAPHAVPLRRCAPLTAASVWLLALALRALLAVALAALAFVHLSHEAIVHTTLGWCWHEVLPELPERVGFDHHPIAHAAVAIPGVVLGTSVIWLGCRLMASWLALRRQISRSLGTGPLGSTILADERVLVAATRLGRRRILVSDRALGELDDDELAAGLTHELAHMSRHHRPLLLAGCVLAALSRPLPGTRAAERQLCFHLERDADAYTVRELRDPLSLASAICKVAGSQAPAGATGLAGRGSVSLRLQELLQEAPTRCPLIERGARMLALALAALVFVMGSSVPVWAAGGGEPPPAADHSCRHL